MTAVCECIFTKSTVIKFQSKIIFDMVFVVYVYGVKVRQVVATILVLGLGLLLPLRDSLLIVTLVQTPWQKFANFRLDWLSLGDLGKWVSSLQLCFLCVLLCLCFSVSSNDLPCNPTYLVPSPGAVYRQWGEGRLQQTKALRGKVGKMIQVCG